MKAILSMTLTLGHQTVAVMEECEAEPITEAQGSMSVESALLYSTDVLRRKLAMKYYDAKSRAGWRAADDYHNS